jgi:hypothetical protein
LSSDRSVRQPLILPGKRYIGSPKPYPDFRVICVGTHNASTRKRLGVPLDLLVGEPLLEGRLTKEIGCDKLMADATEEILPPRVVNVAPTESIKRRVYTLLQKVIAATERHLPCLPLPVYTP